jgi:hypothetical protein
VSEIAPDPELTSEQRSQVEALTFEDVRAIDEALPAASSQTWRKVAFVVGSAMQSLSGRRLGVPDIYFSQRVRVLVGSGKLNLQGNPSSMRSSEICLPASATG